MKTAIKRRPGEYLRLAVSHYAVMAIYQAIRFSYRLSYGFRLIGVENMPDDGPAIILPSDSQSLGGVLAQGVANIGLLQPFFAREGVVCFMHEQLVANVFSRIPMRMRTYGLRPHGSGTMALSLIDGYRELRRGGIAIIAPEGDTCFDGKTVAVRDGCAWLGLRTAAPLIPLIPTAGCYDIWPFWQAKPRLTGRMDLLVGEPFRLTETPLAVVSEDDLRQAKAQLQERIDLLRFGPGGIADWQGQPHLRGAPVEPTIQVRRRETGSDYEPVKASIKRKGMAVLLFQCPVCGANDSIAHHRRVFGGHRLTCSACDAVWAIERRPGHDFALTLTQGPAEIVGLEMALSQWYASLKQDLNMPPLADAALASGHADEHPLLQANMVRLTAHDSTVAPALSQSGPAPTKRKEGHLALPEKGLVGEGRLLLTNQRLIWDSNGRVVDFALDQVRAVMLPFRNVISIAHGAAWYSFNLGDESALKWGAYADRVLERFATTGRPKATISPY